MKIVFVTPWYGDTIPGGAEKETRDLIRHLSEFYDIEIVTTCIEHHYSQWSSDYHAPGVTQHGRITIRRFPVIVTDAKKFHLAYTKITQEQKWGMADEADYIGNFFDSPELFSYLSTVTDTCFFIPYFMPTTVKGVSLVQGKSYVIACLHDEPYARMGMVKYALESATGLIFHVDAEKKLAQELYDVPDEKCHVFGEGIGMGVNISHTSSDPYFLYVGKVEKGKNVDQLFAYFSEFLRRHPELNCTLEVVGKNSGGYPPSEGICLHNEVSHQKLSELYSNASALIQPSLLESFSLVVMESFLYRRPVVVHADCAVTKEHAQKGNAGLWYDSYEVFEQCLLYILEHKDVADEMGKNGFSYTKRFSWDEVIARYKTLL